MSSTLRLSIITVLLLSTTALGLIAYSNMNTGPTGPAGDSGTFHSDSF